MKPVITALFLIVLNVAARAQSSMEKQLFDLVNKERQKAKLDKLEWSSKLAEAALAHSKLLAEHQDLSHQFAGEMPLEQRIGVTGLRFNSDAENVGEAPDVATVHNAFMHSPGHRANILNNKYNAIGISIVEHGNQLFVTEDFAHAVASYTEKQIQDAIISSITQTRRARKLPSLHIVSDARLRQAACNQDMNTDKMIQGLPGATELLVFSESEPGKLSDDMRRTAADPTVDRMNIGVCLETGRKNGFSHFWVVAAFYPNTENSQ